MDRSSAMSAGSRRVSVLFNEPKLLKSIYDEALAIVPEVSVLFNEPKLLKSRDLTARLLVVPRFSALQRAEIAEIRSRRTSGSVLGTVSVLFNEPKLLKSSAGTV